MNSLLKNFGKMVGAVGLSVGFVCMAQAGQAYAGEKKLQSKKLQSKKLQPKKHSGDSFQFILSNKVYSGDPQSKFVRQTCEPGQHKKNLSHKGHSGKKAGSGS